MTLRDRIKERLAAIGMKQAELVRRSGVPQSTLASILQRDTRSTPHLMRLAAALRTTPAYLLGETDDPKSEVPEFSLSFQERALVQSLRLLSQSDFEIVSHLIDRLCEPRTAYAYREEDVGPDATLHDRRPGYGQKPEMKTWKA